MASFPFQSEGEGYTDTRKMPEEEKEEEEYLRRYLPLYKSVLKGDWVTARNFFDNKQALTDKITEDSETVLHIAVGTGKHIYIVKELLKMIETTELETLTNQMGETALHYAAAFGNTEAAKLLVAKNASLPDIPSMLWWPIHLAARHGHRDMVSYLMIVTSEPRHTDDPNPFDVGLLNLLIDAEFYEEALQVLKRNRGLATLATWEPYADNTALCRLAGKPSAFPSGSHLGPLQRFIYSRVPVKFENYNIVGGRDVENPDNSSQVHTQKPCWIRLCQRLRAVIWEVIGRLDGQTEVKVYVIVDLMAAPHIKRIQDRRTMHDRSRQLLKCLCTDILKSYPGKASEIVGPPLLLAAKLGIHEVVEEILESFPYAIRSWDKDRHDIFQVALMNRREHVFKLLNQMSAHNHSVKRMRDMSEDTFLRIAGKLAPPSQLNLVSGAALQMQRELQWYEEVKNLVRPVYKEREDINGKTPAALFTEEHQDLVKKGEKWMKDTANSCTIAAALIATIAFAAAITVPGGNNNEGPPNFSDNPVFTIFGASNALSLFSSTASLLIFLSILTARYAEADFLRALPTRLIIGLVTLFLSITAMMMTFSATLYLMFGHKEIWTLALMVLLASLPVTLFVSLQSPLLVDMTISTYWQGNFAKKK